VSPPLNGKHSIECRVYPRHACSLDVACQPVAARDKEDPIWEGQIKNLSLGGVGLLLNRRFERGVSLAIEVTVGDDLSETHLTRVVHVRAAAGGRWVHGCEFVSKLSDDELQRLLQQQTNSGAVAAPIAPLPHAPVVAVVAAPIVPPPPAAVATVVAASMAAPVPVSAPARKEVRATKRHRVSGSARWRCTAAGEKRSCPIQDLSALGIALVFPGPISLNTVLEIDLSHGAELVAQVQGRVVNVFRSGDDAWIIGCAFIEELRAHALLPLHEEARRSRSLEMALAYPCPVELVFVAGAATVPELTQGRVHNVSPGAIGVILPDTYPNGAVLSLSIPLATTGRDAFLVRVVVVTEHLNGGWMHGCEFANRLSEEQLQAVIGN